jgi:hypothetical protein
MFIISSQERQVAMHQEISSHYARHVMMLIMMGRLRKNSKDKSLIEIVPSWVS